MYKVFARALTALLAVFAYISVHECGHALAAVTFGRKITEVRLVSLKPRVLLRGPTIATEQAIAAAAGSGLVLAMWSIFLIIRRTGPAGFVTDCFTLFAGIELLAWFMSACTHTISPPNNDVTKFIEYSSLNPVLVAGVTGLIAVIAAALYSRQTRPTFSL